MSTESEFYQSYREALADRAKETGLTEEEVEHVCPYNIYLKGLLCTDLEPEDIAAVEAELDDRPPLEADLDSLDRWRRLRPSAAQMLRLSAQKAFRHVRDGGTELWGNGFMLLVGSPPDVPLEKDTRYTGSFNIKRLLTPGACPVEPLLYLEAEGRGRLDRNLVVMEMRSPMDGHLMEHLAVSARMALFVERECQSRFGADWQMGWRGNLSAETQNLPKVCARILPRPLTYCVQGQDREDWLVAGVVMPRVADHRIVPMGGSPALVYDADRRVYRREMTEGDENGMANS